MGGNFLKTGIIFLCAAAVFGVLFAGRTNVYCSLFMFFLGLIFLAFFVYALGIKGAVPLFFKKEESLKKAFFKKCFYSGGLAGVIMSAAAFWGLKLPLSVWLPVMFLPLAFSGIFHPVMFYDEKTDSYGDVSFGKLFLLSIGLGFGLLCVLTGSYFHGLNF